MPTPTVSRTELIAKLDGMIHASLKDYVDPDQQIAILDFPDIRNCGDSAIWLGEVAYLKKYFNKTPDYVARVRDFSVEGLNSKAPEGPIFMQGGGRIGDLWPGHQVFLIHVLEKFPNRRVVQFPQSIHYNSEKNVEPLARAIDAHKDFTLFVRDLESKELAERYFNCSVRLCPDMAFGIGALPPRPTQIDVLAMLRDDKEKVPSSEGWTWPDIPKEDWINESRRKVQLAKVMGAASALLSMRPGEMRSTMLDAAAHQRFERGISQISRARAIITDRLHVHICSMLLGRPNAVLDNNYGKIRRFIETFSDGTDLVYRATSLKDAVEWARQQAGQARGQ